MALRSSTPMYMAEASLLRQTTSRWRRFSRNTLQQLLHSSQGWCLGFRNTTQGKYVQGKNVRLADALSRISPCPGDTCTIEGLDVSVHELQPHLNASPTRIVQIKEETTKDEVLLSLRSIITQGWPDTRSNCPAHLHAFWNYRDELAIADGVILKGTRIIIPKSLQADVLQKLHYAHQGAEKCKRRAKGSVFWVNINRDIEEMVKSCAPCQHNQNMNLKEPLIPHDIPQKPWHTLGCDLFFWKTHPICCYLTITASSRWCENWTTSGQTQQ